LVKCVAYQLPITTGFIQSRKIKQDGQDEQDKFLLPLENSQVKVDFASQSNKNYPANPVNPIKFLL
jgi:hypothetical protein